MKSNLGVVLKYHRSIHLIGGALAVLSGIVSYYSFRVDPFGHTGQIVLILFLLLLMGGLYTLAALGVTWNHFNASLGTILFWGMAMRLVLLPSVPILETDYYRYLWDGYLTTQGVNPYQYPPSEFLLEPESNHPAQGDDLNRIRHWVQQNEQAQTVLLNINHSEIRTIYPPFSQILFALSNTISPLNLYAWRAVVLFFDLILIWMICLLLQQFNLPSTRVIFYAWSPLVLKEIINTTHVDGIALALMMMVFLFFCVNSHGRAGAALACTILTKGFTLVLVPLWYRRIRGLDFAWLLAISGIMIFLFMIPGDSETQGLATFAQNWESNSSLVRLLESFLLMLGFPAWGQGTQWFIWSSTQFYWDAFMLAKIICALFYCLILAGLTIKGFNHSNNHLLMMYYSFWALGALLLFSPVANPWYIVWVVPFLCFFPYASWLYLSLVCILYYWYFQGTTIQYDLWVVLVQYLPFYGLLIYEICRYSIITPGHEIK